jgi:hypothetical protein
MRTAISPTVIRLLGIACVLMGSLCSLFAQSAPLIPDGTYEIISDNSGLPLAAVSDVNGAAAVQQTYAGTEDQQWTLTNLGNNVVELVLSGTNEALESPGNSTVDGIHLDVSSYLGGSGQQWKLVSTGAGFYELVNVASGYAVNVSGNSSASGATTCQWNASATLNERWSFTLIAGSTGTGTGTPTPPAPTLYALTVTAGSGSGSYAAAASVTVTANAAPGGMTFTGWTGNTSALASASSSTTTLTMPAAATSITATYVAAAPSSGGSGSSGSILADGTYEIISDSSALALAGGSASNGAQVVQQIYTGSPIQQWNVTNLGGNVVELTLAGTGEALETPNGSLVAGANLDVSSYLGDTYQQWQVVSFAGGYVELVNVDSGYAINVSGNSSAAGTRMCQWGANGSQNSLWSFHALTPSNPAPPPVSPPVSTSGSPFGVASDAAQTSNGAAWMPTIAATGVQWTRLSAAWNQIEPTQGTFNYSAMDSIVANATANNLTISGFLAYGTPWANTNGGAFPTGSLPDWSTYVGNMTARYAGTITYWEVWNEPDNAANATPGDYAATVAAAYTAAKAANPNAQIGLTVSDVNVNWMKQAINSGAADHFDYVAVHPYSVLSNMSQGWEGDYLGIVKTIRAMLAANDPARANVPIWFTEIGGQIGSGSTTETVQAANLVKAYSMGLAEGVNRIDWFEGKDGDSGAFGLLDGTGTERMSYHAMKSLIGSLGTTPAYQGWLLLNGQDYGFVFTNGTNPVMALWAPPGVTDSVTFSASIQVVNPLTEAVTGLPAGTALALTNTPVIIRGVPSDLLATAQANESQPFPWKGNFMGATMVGIQMGNPNVESGLHQMNTSTFSPALVQGAWVEDVSSSSGQNYMVDPNVMAYTPRNIRVSVTVMAKDSSAGFNFKYESVNGFEGIGWNGIPNDGQWHTFTFSPTDDEFVGLWGYNFQLNSDSTLHSNYYLKSVVLQLMP